MTIDLNTQDEKNPKHSQSDCWFQKNNVANFTLTDNLFYSCFTTQLDGKGIWYLDSGCVTRNKSRFFNLRGPLYDN